MSQTNITSIKEILLRDLANLEKEIAAYANEEDVWLIQNDIKNSAGTLVLHICGNLQHFIGAVIGQDGYVRKREEEFSKRNLRVSELLNEIAAAKTAIVKALDKLTDDRLEDNYPLEVFGKPMTFSYFLIHLSGHLMYHLGQINYHRRLLAS